jgi:hypothetical protein
MTPDGSGRGHVEKAVAIARSLTHTFAGVHAVDVSAFAVAEIAGALLAPLFQDGSC